MSGNGASNAIVVIVLALAIIAVAVFFSINPGTCAPGEQVTWVRNVWGGAEPICIKRPH